MNPTEFSAKILQNFCPWGPTALLPVFQLLGTDYSSKTIATHLLREDLDYDTFTKISLIYPHVTSAEGIIDHDVDQSIHNLTSIGKEAMCSTDDMVLEIMTHKTPC